MAPQPGYIYLHATSSRSREHRERLTRQLIEVGWRTDLETPSGCLLQGPGHRHPIRRFGRGGLVLGRYHADPGAPAADPVATAHGLVRGGWGRYVVIWEANDTLCILRDPSGGLDAATWYVGGVSVVASSIPEGCDALLPEEAALDLDQLARTLRFAAANANGIGVRGLEGVPPGALVQRTRAHASTTSIWRPLDSALLDNSGQPDALRDVVDSTVRRLMAPHEKVVGEISGGFDSAVVSASAVSSGRARMVRWLNYYSGEAESDERAYADVHAALLGVAVDARRKTATPLDAQAFAALATGLRPALQGLDVEYDGDVAATMASTGATALLTGQGGDAVFFQSGSPALVVDRVRRRGLAGLDPRFLHRTARWTGRSVWTLADIGLREHLGRPQRPPEDSFAPEPDAAVHPWLQGIEQLPPAKRGQVRQLVNCQVFWGDCLRARAGELLHPLLTQPVMEHCLAIPADRLTEGSVDRALARIAFRDRLPQAILERRGKGELSTYYGQVVLRSLPFFRETLMDGELARRGLIDRAETEALLDPDVLIWSGDFNLVLIRTLLELWVRHWTGRLAGRSQIPVEPGDHA